MIDAAMFSTSAVIAAIGIVSALLCLRRRLWLDAALVLVAALSLAAMTGGFALPGSDAGTVAIGDEQMPAHADKAAAFALSGDGLRAAQWHDLPARPLLWTAPATDTLDLDFPRQLDLGRMFALTVRRSPAPKSWRLQLLAENEQVLADTSGSGAQLTVRWLPPVAETMLLQARVLDAAGKTVAQGPVPLSVRASAPLQVQGRFNAPSFDAQALNRLLANSNAILDWQITLGKTVTRSETARAPLTAPNLLTIDAAYFEHMNPGARSALLAQVGEGMPLVILAANASDVALWSRELQLPLKPQGDDKPVLRQFGPDLALPLAPLAPAGASAGPWTAGDKQAWLWARDWHKGRIVWLGVMDWHRYAISAPLALASWWQSVIDQAGVQRREDFAWQFPEAMPMIGERTDICLEGAPAGTTLSVPDQKLDLVPQRRADRADAACAAFWPAHAGWLRVQTVAAAGQSAKTEAATPAGDARVNAKTLAPSAKSDAVADRVAAAIYVYGKDDWPAWQRALRRAATARYAARTPIAPASGSRPLPVWPFAALFAAAILALWWRERR